MLAVPPPTSYNLPMDPALREFLLFLLPFLFGVSVGVLLSTLIHHLWPNTP